MTKIEPGSAAREITAALEKAGHEAWLVGGCVRDALMGLEPHDVDIATDALPSETQRIFAKTVPTGEKYGTVTVFTDSGKAEVTTFRGKERYGGSRRPSSLVFGVDINEDLARRDFTVNAMAYNPRQGLLDPFGGREDLTRGTIRAVGEPKARFAEDPLRILRAFRFAAKLGFSIEKDTLAAAKESIPLCSALSGERVRAEIENILMSEAPEKAEELAKLGFFDAVGVSRSGETRWDKLAAVPKDIRARWAALIMTSALSQNELFERLKFSNRLKNDVSVLLRELDRQPPHMQNEVRARLAGIDPDAADNDAARPGNTHAGAKYISDPRRASACPGTLRPGSMRLGVVSLDAVRSGFSRQDALFNDTVHPGSGRLGVTRSDSAGSGAVTPELFRLYVETYSALSGEDETAVLEALDKVLDSGDPYSIAMLPIDGGDLLRLGVPRGPRIRELLDRALTESVRDPSLGRSELLRALGFEESAHG